MPVRSHVLFAFRSTVAGNYAPSAVPTGTTWIVKSAYATHRGTIAGTWAIRALRGGTTPVVEFYSASLAAGSDGANVGTWYVLEAGDVIQVQVPDTGVDVWISGATLIA